MHKTAPEIYSNFIALHKKTQSASWQFLNEQQLIGQSIKKSLTEDFYQQLLHISDENQFMAKIRQVRNAHMIKIASEDIKAVNSIKNLKKCMLECSLLARFMVDLCYKRAYENMGKIYGYAYGQNGEIQPMIILALGKLGANELNYSSDVDLIFCFAKSGHTNGARKITNFEFFAKVAQKMIYYLSSKIADGFVFRVDVRLRPFGNSGALVSSFSSIENYYLTHGRYWERYALIKMSLVEPYLTKEKQPNLTYFTQLKKNILPFIFRKYLDFSVFEALRDMKALIDAESKVSKHKDHIKLGFGGIRLVEFIAQSFQLIYGGRNPNLQTTSLKTALFTLVEMNLIDQQKAEDLWQGYSFLRVVENRLQQRNDFQAHQLFSEQREKLLLAQSMGFNEYADFLTVLDYYRQQIQNYFDQILKTKKQAEQPWRSIWLTAINPSLLSEQMKSQNKEKFLFLVSSLCEQKMLIKRATLSAKLDSDTNRFMSLFLEILEYYYDKHLAINQNIELEEQNSEKVFLRVMNLVQSTFFSNIYLVMLSENVELIKRLCRTARASGMLIDILSKNPFLIDQLLDRSSLYQLFDPNEVTEHLNQPYLGDLNDEMEKLRIFNHQRVLSIAMQDVMKDLPLAEVSNQLTYVCEGILKRVVECAWLDIAPKFPQFNLKINQSFCIIACGKFGGLELSYSSDLDLVFLCTNQKYLSFYTRLVQRIIHMLEITTNTGKLFTIDLRLRPNGNSGALVNPLEVWFEYQLKQAWLWEHQSLCRARGVAGDESMINKFNQMRKTIICQKRDQNQLKNEVIQMREKMRKELDQSSSVLFDLKQGYGGIVDIEFLVQYLLLKNAHQYPQLIEYSDNLRQIEALINCRIFKQDEGEALIDSYFAMRSITHELALENQKALIDLNLIANHTKIVQQISKDYFS